MTNYHFWRGDRIRLRAIEQKDLDAVARSYDQIYFGMTSEEFDRIDSPLDLWEDTTYGVSPRTELT